MINWIRDLFDPAVFGGRRRSKHWRRVRNEHIKKFPLCAVTGSKKKVEVHHIEDFSSNPVRELDPTNLISLRRDIHLLFGHCGNYKSINPDVVKDAELWKTKLQNRR